MFFKKYGKFYQPKTMAEIADTFGNIFTCIAFLFGVNFSSVANGIFFSNYVQFCDEPGARVEEAM